MERIDSHHHFWIYNEKEYDWISDDMKVLRRDFLPRDLRATIRPFDVTGVVSVQARQTLEETAFLLELAGLEPWVRGVVGWAPLVDKSVGKVLEGLTQNRKLKGIRHVLQSEPDDDYVLRADFNEGVKLLNGFGLAYDILIFERHLPQAMKFVDRHPRLRFILDHIAKPRIREHLLYPWRDHMIELARRENVYCKLSGVVTEAAWGAWTSSEVAPYIETAMEAFGPKRLMFGSDWPVMLVSSPYEAWVGAVTAFTEHLSESEQARIWAGSAVEAYWL